MEPVYVADEDGNSLEIMPCDSEDLFDLLLVAVTDENEIPIGMFLDVRNAITVRNALDVFIRNAS